MIQRTWLWSARRKETVSSRSVSYTHLEIGLLVDTYNPTLKNVKDTYSDTKDDYKDVDKLKNQIMEGSGSLADQAGQLSGMAGTFEDLLGYQNMVTPGTYAELVYSDVYKRQWPLWSPWSSYGCSLAT